MQKNIAIPLLAFLLMQLPAATQELSNTLEVDRESYALYEAGRWKELNRYARKAKRSGFDFYYLRYRQGIAQYELKRYRQAAGQFEMVREGNPDDATVGEYLYYSYLLGARPEDARVLSHSFDEALRGKLGLTEPSKLANGIGAEYKHYLFEDFTARGAAPSGALEQKVRKSLHFVNFGLTHLSRKSFSLYHAASFLWGLNRVFDPARQVYEFNENLWQFQYYVAGSWNLGKGLDLTTGLHYVRTTLEGLNPAYDARGGMGRQNPRYLFITHENSFAGFLKLSKSIHNFNFRISGTASGLNGGIQYQPSAGMDFYPLGNTHLYISGDATYLLAPDEERYDPGLVLRGKAGFRLGGPLWLEPFGQLGRVSNYADEDAYVIYNSNDAIDHWYGVRVNLFLADYRLNIYYIYQQYRNTNFYKVGGMPAETGYDSSTHLLGLRWKL